MVSVPQAAGIPVTHRGSAASVHVVNGQAETSSSTIAALADDTVTTVVLMGVAALPRLVVPALAADVPGDRPVGIIERGHTPEQAHHAHHALASRGRRRRGRSPHPVVIVGEVARPACFDREMAGGADR